MTELADEDRELLRDMSDRANTLYWNSDRSVNSIASDLGLSKGRLYELIRPLGSEQECPNCQSELVFENRTSHEREDSVCPVCDLEGVPVESVRSAARRFSEMAASEALASSRETSTSDPADASETTAPAPFSPDARGVVAGLLVGTVAGVLLGRYLRH
jgi:hypothetical protein